MILKTFKKFGRAQLVVEDSINQFNTVFQFQILHLLHTIFMESESQILQKNTQFVLEVFTFKSSGVCINLFPLALLKSKNLATNLFLRASLKKSTIIFIYIMKQKAIIPKPMEKQ